MPVEKDYLQVFELTVEYIHGQPHQKIIHRQEHPEYRREYIFCIEKPVNEKIYVIDDKTHTTMLLADEY